MQARLQFPRTSGWKVALALTGCLVLTRCDDAPVPLADARTSIPAVPRWQDPSAGTAPDFWLASLDSGSPKRPPPELVARFRQLLGEASLAYIETPRMVANRLVQAQDTIGTTPGLEDIADATLEVLFRRLLFRGRDGQKLIFGTVVHHYLNLLRQGLDDDAAAARLGAEFRAERVANVP